MDVTTATTTTTAAPAAGQVSFVTKLDLVKRHLMYAVREEVEILKQQIGEMMERIGQLEYENTVLRAEAKPETLNKLQQPRAASQAATQGQAATQATAQAVAAGQSQATSPAGQPTASTATLVPQQQHQSAALSGTSTPILQQQQQQQIPPQVSAQQAPIS